MTPPDVRTAAQAEAEVSIHVPVWSPTHDIRADLAPLARQHFIAGAVWGAARVTPTREQIAEILKASSLKWGGPSLKEFENDPPTRKHYAQADAVLALMQNQPKGD